MIPLLKIAKKPIAGIVFILMALPLAAQVDTLRKAGVVVGETKPKGKSYLESVITYPAKDSTIISLTDKKIKQYGGAKVTYDNIELTADYIEMSIDRKEVYASGRKDSSGQWVGKPVFKEGKESYECSEIKYNFETGKAYVVDVKMNQELQGDKGYLQSHITKMDSSGIMNIKDGKFSTCDAEIPHFYFAITKGRVIPDKETVTGPMYLVVEGVPLYPVGLPFGFLPKKQERASGILMPKYGEERNRGFFLRDGGYYFAINEKIDLSLTGGIYSRGSWALGAQSKYARRYKFNGNFAFNYARNILGEKDLPGYSNKKDFSVRWSHSQDPKAHPYRNFNASVNFSTSSFDKNNTYGNYQNPIEHLTNQKSSSISYSRKFPNKLFNFTTKLGHTQNSSDSTVVLNFPSGSFTVGRFYPFRFGAAGGRYKWYEMIEMRYTANFENKIKAREDSLFLPDMNFNRDYLSKMRNGFQHEIPISASFKPMKDMTLTPTLSYVGVMYFSELEKSWDAETNKVLINRINRINYIQAISPNINLSYSPRLYAYYDFYKGNVKTIRHMMSPQISFGYRPDLGYDFSRYSRTLVAGELNDEGKTEMDEFTYSIFDEGLYRLPSVAGRSGIINFSLGNNVEMKVLDKKDSTGTKQNKVKLLESLNLSTSYDIFKDSLNLSPISLTGRTTILNQFNINFRGQFNAYAADSIIKNNRTMYQTVNALEITRSGKPLRLTSADFSLGFQLPLKSTQSGTQQQKATPNPSMTYDDMPDFQGKWNLNVEYVFQYNKPYFKSDITQSLRLRGGISLTEKWKADFSTGYDFVKQVFTYTSFSLNRDLHCWVMRIEVVPFGERKSYTFTLAAKASLLKDVKYMKQKSWMDN